MWPDGSPEAALLAFVTAVEAEDWAEATAWIDPVNGHAHAVERRRLFLERRPTSTPTAAEYQKLYPDAPPEVVAWQAERHAEAAARRPNEVAEVFAGVASQAALEALTPTELVRALLEAADIRYQMRLVYAANGYPIHRAAEEAHQPRALRVVGHLRDGPERALVLLRAHGTSPEGTMWEGEAEVIELRRQATGRWGLPLNHTLTGASGATVFLFGAGPAGSDAPAVNGRGDR